MTAIFNTYLGDENSQLCVPRCLHVINADIDATIERLLANCFQNLEQSQSTVFDDFETVCLQTLDDFFRGNISRQGIYSSGNLVDPAVTITTSTVSIPLSLRSDSAISLINDCQRGFFQSAQYQIMERDLHGAVYFTNRHMERIVQRLLDLPLHYYFDCAQLIINHLEAMFPGDWRHQVPFSKRLLSLSTVITNSTKSAGSSGSKVQDPH